MSENFREHTILGRTGLKVSRLGIGAGYGVPAGAVEKAYRQFGVNYFHWGSRRAGMKEAIRRLVPKERDKMVIALQSYDHSGFYLKRSVNKGLKELEIEYADILILGWYNWFPNDRILKRALKLKKKGKIRFLAVSGHNRNLFGRLARREDSPFDIFMIRYNAEHPKAETDIFRYLPETDRPGIVSYTATSWSRLLNPKKMPPGEKPLEASECYRFALTNPHVDLCLTGPRNPEEMDQALTVLDDGPLPPEEMERVRRIGDYLHR
ncbi:MAG: aldo/keto reductase [Proteobacteria bacterium]|nr:aldo/keto reductase [Pseudomonadota bacterium]